MKDDNVKLPAQVLKQKEKADRLWNEQHGKTDDRDKPIPDKAPDAEPEPVVELEPELESVEELVVEEEPELEPELEPEPEPTDLQHKFDVLRGKYDAEVPRLSAENKQLRDHTIELGQIIGTLQTEVEKLKAGKEVPEKSTTDTGEIVRQFLNEEELEELQGAVDPKLLGKVVDGLIKSRMQPFEQGLTSVKDTQFRTAEDVFWEKIDAIPNVNEIDKSSGFNSWLNQKAPYTHLTRRQILKDAQINFDAATVVELFSDFAKTTPGPGGTGKPTPPKSPPRKPRISPAKGAGASNLPAEGKIWTVKEINTFYVDIQKGKYRGKDKERKQIEKDIWNAQKDGRIRKT